MRKSQAALALALMILAAAPAARAEILSKHDRFEGVDIDYKVLLPPGYSPQKAYPLVLVFTGGAQLISAAQNTLEVDWAAQAQARGYIVVSPAAPGGQLFFQDGDKVFPAFLDRLLKDYRVAGKIHIAGHSNGGLSAFHIASQYPNYFSTVTGYPGLLQDPESDPMSALRGLCLYMHVGALDKEWRMAMEQQAGQMRADGYRVSLTVEKNQTHRLKEAELHLSQRLFDEIESCR